MYSSSNSLSSSTLPKRNPSIGSSSPSGSDITSNSSGFRNAGEKQTFGTNYSHVKVHSLLKCLHSNSFIKIKIMWLLKWSAGSASIMLKHSWIIIGLRVYIRKNSFLKRKNIFFEDTRSFLICIAPWNCRYPRRILAEKIKVLERMPCLSDEWKRTSYSVRDKISNETEALAYIWSDRYLEDKTWTVVTFSQWNRVTYIDIHT